MNIMSGYLEIKDLNRIALGLNIEGNRPSKYMPAGCKWYNIVQVIDTPLSGVSFDHIMEQVMGNHYDLIEMTIPGFVLEEYLNFICTLISKIQLCHNRLLVHVHQYKGTTVLDRLIEERTGIECILDETNYYESPIDYSKRDIDGLISLSQCAGFGLPAGTWIRPTGFMEFNVGDDVTPPHIFTEMEDKDLNFIDEFIDPSANIVRGPLLRVNAIWNPDLKNDGVLLLDRKDRKVLDFVRDKTAIFDNSHNWQHALQVAYNATKILNTREVLLLALLHDVCDHKYPEAIPRDGLSAWIKDNLPDYPNINSYIDEISFSKQKTMDRCAPEIEAVRDGDRLEALGEIGIRRAEAIVRRKGGVIPDDVIQHCHEKLLKLLPEGYIVTGEGRRMAAARHQRIEQYVLYGS